MSSRAEGAKRRWANSTPEQRREQTRGARACHPAAMETRLANALERRSEDLVRAIAGLSPRHRQHVIDYLDQLVRRLK